MFQIDSHLFALAGVRLQVVGVGDLGALSVLAAALQLLALHAVVSGPAIIATGIFPNIYPIPNLGECTKPTCKYVARSTVHV